MTHPSSITLESIAVGEERTAADAAHIEACAACAAFLAELRGVVEAGPSVEEADAAVARALARTDRSPHADQESAREAGADAAHEGGRSQARKRRAWMLATSVVAPLAAAAAIVLLARGTPLEGPMPSPPPSAPEGTSVAAAPVAPAATAAAPEPDTQFKGGMQIAVVRERGGKQERFSGAVRVRPGDRLRVEVALDHEQAILGAVLDDDGDYLELMPPGTRGPGTHFSERSAKIDAAVTRGTVIVGSPEAVARARATRQLAGVGTLRVEWEAP